MHRLVVLLLLGAAVATADSTNTNIENYPFMTSIGKKGENNVHLCEGVILKNNYVLTTRLCIGIRKPGELTVRAGSTNFNEGGKLYYVKDVIIHPVIHDWINDVAILRTTQPMEFNRQVGSVNLINKNERPKHGEIVAEVGWMLNQSNSSGSAPLKEVRLPYVDDIKCAIQYSKKNYVVWKTMTCAGGNKRVTGASASAALLNKDKKLIGIHSWIGITDYPEVFADIASRSIRKFIDDTVK